LAVLMSFALAPLVSLLKRWHLGHVAPVLISVLLAVVVLTSLGGFVGSQLAKLASELPGYQTNLSNKIQSVVGGAINSNTMVRLNRTVENLAEQITGSHRAEEAATAADQVRPIPVIIRRTSVAPWSVAQTVLGPLLEPLGLI